MTRRVILGNLGSGVYGLRVSLPGHDVVSEAGNDDAMSFDSGWTDLAKLIQIGTATKTADFSLTDIPFTNPGYTPFAEVRLRSGNRAYDDFSPFHNTNQDNTRYSGIGARVLSDRLQLDAPFAGSAITYDVVYAVFAVPLSAT